MDKLPGVRDVAKAYNKGYCVAAPSNNLRAGVHIRTCNDGLHNRDGTSRDAPKPNDQGEIVDVDVYK